MMVDKVHEKFTDIVTELDEDNDGTISWSEFVKILDHEMVPPGGPGSQSRERPKTKIHKKLKTRSREQQIISHFRFGAHFA